ncbi:SacI homology domain-containing protein [Phakopsora pachyrhizi]|nr:SacI homology domain-containing protein [Phakopsora pachyrhizi]
MQKTMSTVEMNKMNNSFSISSSRLPKKYTEDKFPICISNRKAYVWDIDCVLDLKMQTSTLAQQNVFLGLPLELMPEEVFSLAKSGIAIFIDEKQAHCAPTLKEASLFKAKEDTRIANDIRILTLREAERRVAMKDQYCSEIELTETPNIPKETPTQTVPQSPSPIPIPNTPLPQNENQILPETTRDGGTDDNCIDHQQLHRDPIDPEYILGSPTLEMVRYSHPQFINTDEQRDRPGCNNNSLNHNQHQQHLPTSSTMAKKLIMASFVQTRGSVPIFWTEIYNLRYKPDLKIMDVPQTQESMKAHFNQQVKIYGDQYLVNLVNSSGCEKPVKYYYERGDHDKQDIYALCASSTLLYTQARENKQQGPEAAFDQASKFFRLTEFFEKALQLDPQCAFAAHGLAIALAEHALGPGGPAAYNANPISSASESSVLRVKNLRDSITILNKVREALNDGRVYVNLGHCHYLRDKFESSIENTASRRFCKGKNAQVLLYLARTWYQKASKDKSFHSLRNALNCAQEQERRLDLAAKNEELSRKQQEMLDSAATWYVRQNSDAESDVNYAKKKKRNSSVKRKNKETGIMIVPDGEGEGEDENYDSDDGPVRNNKKKPGKVYVSIAISATTI